MATLRGERTVCAWHDTRHDEPAVLQLNQAKLKPKQEHATGRWQPGGAQLPAHTQLLVDETVLQSGRLTETGISNLRVRS